MGMKKATKERITAAYDKGFKDGYAAGHQRAVSIEEIRTRDQEAQENARTAFTDTLEKEADPE